MPLPGAEIVEPGLRDLLAGSLSEESLVVLAAAPRLRRCGVPVPTGFDEIGASLMLYDRLYARLGDGAHSRHHALLRRIASYATTHALTDRR